MKSNLTLVTALFDLGRGEMGTSFSRSFDHYKECFSRLLKMDKFNLVIFCEPELNDFIWQYRNKGNTSIVNRTKDDIRAFPFFDKVQEIRQRPSWINQAGWIADSTQAKLALYNPLVMSKQFFLNDATHYNFFNTDYYLWIDAGITNTVSIEGYMDDDFERRVTKHLNKMMYVCFPYDGTVEVHGFEKEKLNQLADANTTFVARGGVFGGSKHAINEMNDIYYALLHDSMNDGYMGTEESIFTIIAHRHRSKCNLRMIEENGLVYKFFEDLRTEPVHNAPRLAIYVLAFNIPEQFELWLNAFKKAAPRDFDTVKKYVINNSDKKSVMDRYAKLFADNGFEVIHEGSNIGINDGRHLAAVHFSESDHEYMIFFEDDMLLHDGSIKIDARLTGFNTYVDRLFDKAIEILIGNELDYLKLSFSEFYGDNHKDWAWENVPKNRRHEFFPPKGSEEMTSKTKVFYTGSHRGVPYAVGNYHYCNWPLLFSKRGNQRVFLDVQYEHKYEQTLMSHVRMLLEEGKVKAGTLLMSAINHRRDFHYAKQERKENKN